MGISASRSRRMISSRMARSALIPWSRIGCPRSSRTRVWRRARAASDGVPWARARRAASRATPPIAARTNPEMRNGSSPIDRETPRMARQESRAPSGSPSRDRIAESAASSRATPRASWVSRNNVSMMAGVISTSCLPGRASATVRAIETASSSAASSSRRTAAVSSSGRTSGGVSSRRSKASMASVGGGAGRPGKLGGPPGHSGGIRETASATTIAEFSASGIGSRAASRSSSLQSGSSRSASAMASASLRSTNRPATIPRTKAAERSTRAGTPRSQASSRARGRRFLVEDSARGGGSDSPSQSGGASACRPGKSRIGRLAIAQKPPSPDFPRARRTRAAIGPITAPRRAPQQADTT